MPFVLVALLAFWLIAGRGSGAEAATWRLDPSFTPSPEANEIPVRVQESDCASGKSAIGRIELNVRYSSSAVTIGIRVRSLGGARTCQAVETPYTVKLKEPLGNRVLIDANARTP